MRGGVGVVRYGAGDDESESADLVEAECRSRGRWLLKRMVKCKVGVGVVCPSME